MNFITGALILARIDCPVNITAEEYQDYTHRYNLLDYEVRLSIECDVFWIVRVRILFSPII